MIKKIYNLIQYLISAKYLFINLKCLYKNELNSIKQLYIFILAGVIR